MARRKTTSEPKQIREERESQEDIREQTAGRGTASATTSSWWEERKRIEKPRMEEQEGRYREEQERYEQERQKEKYYRPIGKVERSEMEEQERSYREEQERYEPGRQMRAGRIEQTTGRETELATPASWWEARASIIERPRPEEQERHYREEQERYEQERQRATYYRPIEEVERPRPEDQERRYREEQERYEPGRQMRGEQMRMEQGREERRELGGEGRDIFQIWADSYGAVSRMWEESFTNLYKPWLESTGEMFTKAAELSRNATPENYRSFYDEWIKTYQSTFGNLYPAMTRQFDRETIEKLMNSAEESRALFQSWITMLDENTKKTQELLQGTPEPGKYRELFDMWTRTYGKIFEEFAEMPTKGSTKEVLETYGGVPGMYLNNFVRMAKLWNESYMYLFRPWVDSMLSFSGKMAELSRGEARPEAYKEFYNMWIDTYRNYYSRLFNPQSISSSSREMADSFLRSMNVYMNMYNSWMDSLGQISQRTVDISTRTAEPEASKEPYNTWVSMYERAFDDFFKYVPAVSPLKSMMEPVKNAVKINTDMFANLSNMWMKSVPGSTSRT